MPTTSHSVLAEKTVGQAMHQGVLTCPRTMTLLAVARMMAAHRVHCVVVSEEMTRGSTRAFALWGVISDLDLIAAARIRPLDEQTAEGSAATPAVLITPEEPLSRAAQLMTDHSVSHLVVVDGRDDRPVGVISTLDMAEALS